MIKGKGKKASPGQMKLLWDTSEATNPEIVAVAKKFIFANCYNSQIAEIIFQNCSF